MHHLIIKPIILGSNFFNILEDYYNHGFVLIYINQTLNN